MSASVQSLVSQPYKYGFVTDIEADVIPRGLSEATVRMISAKKNEPEFMLEFRLKAYRKWLTMAEPDWPNVDYPPINYQDIVVGMLVIGGLGTASTAAVKAMPKPMLKWQKRTR